jgi:hypothetical protein
MRLAAALDNAGNYSEAAQQYDMCLSGPFVNDPEVCFGAAKAKWHAQDAQHAIELLQDLREKKPEFRPEQLSILLAQCYASNQDNQSAQDEFIHAVNTFGSIEARGQYALWALSVDDILTAERLRANLEIDWKHWSKHTKSLHKSLFDQLDAEIAAAKLND